MSLYIVYRLLSLLPTLFVPLLLVFILLRMAPGDPASVMLGANATPEQVAALRQEMGLDKPLAVQLTRWIASLATLDLGESIFLGRPVVELVVERIPPTAILTGYALVVAVVVGMAAGIVAAMNRNRPLDQASMGLAMIGVSMPEFWFGLMLILVFGVQLRIFPVAGYVPPSVSLPGCLYSLTLPAFSVGLVHAAFIARITRSSMLDVIHEDYIRTAHAKGLPRRRIVLKHALRNALVPILTVIGITLAVLMGGAIAVESVFNLPGIGRLLISAVARRDYPLIQGIVLFTSIAFVGVNLLVDVLYRLVDPRVGYQ